MESNAFNPQCGLFVVQTMKVLFGSEWLLIRDGHESKYSNWDSL